MRESHGPSAPATVRNTVAASVSGTLPIRWTPEPVAIDAPLDPPAGGRGQYGSDPSVALAYNPANRVGGPGMTDYTAYFGGQWMPFDEVRIDPLDRGFLVGDCVFDVARTFNGKSFRMREHVDRLYRSLAYV